MLGSSWFITAPAQLPAALSKSIQVPYREHFTAQSGPASSTAGTAGTGRGKARGRTSSQAEIAGREKKGNLNSYLTGIAAEQSRSLTHGWTELFRKVTGLLTHCPITAPSPNTKVQRPPPASAPAPSSAVPGGGTGDSPTGNAQCGAALLPHRSPR